jgi:hypothetical protein
MSATENPHTQDRNSSNQICNHSANSLAMYLVRGDWTFGNGASTPDPGAEDGHIYQSKGSFNVNTINYSLLPIE